MPIRHIFRPDGGTIDARGTGPEPIRFSSTLACGDRIGSRSCEAKPGATWLFGGVAVSGPYQGNPAGSGDFEYCTIEHAFNGLSLGGPTPSVSGCRFDGCLYGIVHRPDSQCGRTIKNCLFRDTWLSAIQVNSTDTLSRFGCTVLNSTIYRAWRGIECSANSSATVRNCILDGCTSYGIWASPAIQGYPAANVSESYNCFWQNRFNLSTNLTTGTGDLRQDPKFVNTDAADLYARFYLDQGPSTTSPCVNAGNQYDARFLTTALDKRLDLRPVDIGYHYPVRGHLKVAPNYFFEFEDGEVFYPIAAINAPSAIADTTESPHPEFYATTLPNYLELLSRHGINSMRVIPFQTSERLQNHEINPTSGTGYFLEAGVKEHTKYFDALENKGLCYWVDAYDDKSLTKDPYEHYAGRSIYWVTSGGTVPDDRVGHFFKSDEATTTGRKAREHFKLALNQFLDNRHQAPKWYTRPGLVGWDLFSQIDGQERRPEWDQQVDTTLTKETTITSWTLDMTAYLDTTECLRLGSRRLRWVDVYNLRRLKQWDPEGNQPAYLDMVTNDFIDYNLYTRYSWSRTEMWTEYPVEPFTPLKHYLGVAGDLGTWHCTLPEVIDFYRNPGGGGSRRGGFFSTGFSLRGWFTLPEDQGFNVKPVPRKRLVNDCYHNYMWLTFAGGSVGGPVGGALPGSPVKDHYDLSGVYYDGPVYWLNAYTDEILDSMLSLSRFVSLVQWKLVGPSYRPVRITKDSGGPGMELRSTTSGLVLPENEWLWTAASDTTFMVGWIVRNCPRDYGTPEWLDALTTKPAPRLHITGLQATTTHPLELVWFDDHLGQTVGSRAYSTSGTFNVVTPNTEGKNGFARSIAFLIQPTGLTPSRSYSALPDEKIGMIGATPTDPNEKWYEEGQYVLAGSVTFTVRTKPGTNPSGLTFEWRFDSETTAPIVVSGEDHIHRTYSASNQWRLVKVDIKDQQSKRVSGDITYVWVKPN